MTLLLYTSISLLILLLAFKLFHQTRTRPKLPPSPPSLPILGHLHLIKKPIHRTFHRLSQKYGKVFSIKFGSQLVVIVSSPSAVEECFTKNDVILANRPRSLIGKHLAYNFTTLIASPYGDHWRNLRRISALEIFSNNRLNMFLGIRRDEVKHLLWKLSRNSCQGFAKVELKSMFSELTFNIIMRMVAGKRYYGEDVKYEEEARKFRGLVKEIVALGGVSNPGEFVPVLRWIDRGGLEKKVMGVSKRMDTFLQGLIDEKRSKDEEGNTMIDHMLSLQKSQPEYYTDQIIKGLILLVKSDAHKLIPFGLGRRACPGAGLAQRTMSLTLGSLIQCFEWERVTKEEVDMAEGIAVVMPKAVPLEAMCKARPIMHKVLSESLHDV
uniref:Cytochrome P450 n=1 Tax=Fagus sylvatica TaxID=28930 RepID=A0A2N9HSY0_FAGSY